MRIVYCPACGAVSTSVWSERDVCTRCGSHAEPMAFSRPWQSHVSSAILLVAAAFFIWGPIQDTALRLLVFAAVLVVAYVLASWGLRVVKGRVLQQVRTRSSTEEHA